MIILGEPNLRVSTVKKNRILGTSKRVPLFKFDENGRYETDDENILKLAQKRFSIVAEIAPIPDAINDSGLTGPSGESGIESTFKCKKCAFKTENHGELLAHYRKEHPKKEEEK